MVGATFPDLRVNPGRVEAARPASTSTPRPSPTSKLSLVGELNSYPTISSSSSGFTGKFTNIGNDYIPLIYDFADFRPLPTFSYDGEPYPTLVGTTFQGPVVGEDIIF